MKKNRNEILILCIVFVIFLLLIGLLVFTFHDTDNLNKLIINDELLKKSEDLLEEDDETDNNVIDINDDNNTYFENDVVDYFYNIKNEIVDCDNINLFKDKFKANFITIVDFIFYDSEIKGYKFNDLTDEGKIKIISFAIMIDNELEKKYPGYKEYISITGEKTYNDVKERLVSLYFDISSSICSKNVDECIKTKEIFSDLKINCNIGWSFIKNMFKNGTLRIKSWYEIYSGK